MSVKRVEAVLRLRKKFVESLALVKLFLIMVRKVRKDGRAVECTALEMRQPLTGFGGSNPPLSAKSQS